MTQATLFPEPHVEAPRLKPDQAVIVHALVQGPRTAYELQTRLANLGIHRPINSIGSRLNELAKLGLVVKTGERRPGASSRKLDEWRIK